MEEIQKLIDEYFNTKWYTEDFIEAYKYSREIPKDRELTEEELEDFKRYMTVGNLKGFREVIIGDINERIGYFMDDERR